MTCPYCQREINAMTGFQEVTKFQRHLSKCRKNPRNIVIRDGRRVAVGARGVTLLDALKIRADSGQ